MADAVYRRRRSAMSRGEREWRVEDDSLATSSRPGEVRRVRWADVAAVRLCHEPMRNKPWRYVFELKLHNGRRVELDNAHYVNFNTFEERSEAYTPFVRAAPARIAAVNPNARALIGETPIRYFLLVLAALVGLGALAIALATIRTPLDAWPYMGLVKLGLIFLMLPVFARWVIGAAPKGVPLNAVPERAFPPETRNEEVEARA